MKLFSLSSNFGEMQIFKDNLQPDGRKMQKNFISKSFSKRLKKFANFGSLAEG